jgi:hypothetical protein
VAVSKAEIRAMINAEGFALLVELRFALRKVDARVIVTLLTPPHLQPLVTTRGGRFTSKRDHSHLEASRQSSAI